MAIITLNCFLVERICRLMVAFTTLHTVMVFALTRWQGTISPGLGACIGLFPCSAPESATVIFPFPHLGCSNTHTLTGFSLFQCDQEQPAIKDLVVEFPWWTDQDFGTYHGLGCRLPWRALCPVARTAGQDEGGGGDRGMSEGQSAVGGYMSMNRNCCGTQAPLIRPAYRNPSVSDEPCHRNIHHLCHQIAEKKYVWLGINVTDNSVAAAMILAFSAAMLSFTCRG